MNKDKLIKIVKLASEGWQNAFNNGSAEDASNFYEDNAFIVAKPFGEFKGKQEIKDFWNNIIENGFKDVEYLNPKYEIVDENSVIVSSDWTMNNAKGIITKELWVLQSDGTAKLREDYFEVAE